MHPVQEKILKIAKTQDVLALGIRPLGRMIEVNNPQVVKHHLLQLQKKGLIIPKSFEDIKRLMQNSSGLQPSFVKIPVVGEANCGPATLIAEEHIEKYLTVSQSLLKKTGNIFALVAKGDSLNRADISGNNIEENDYVIIDGDQRNPNPGDYVLSIIDNAANIKRYDRAKNGNVLLLSESTTNYAPIYIGEDDQFMINGKAVQVIKGVTKE